MKLTKRTWIIIAAVAVVGVAGFIVWKKRKAAAMEAGEETGEPGEEKAPETAKTGTSATPAAEKPTSAGVPVSSAMAEKLKTQPGAVIKTQVPVKTLAPVTTYSAPTTSRVVTPVAKPVVAAPVKTTAPVAPVRTTAPVAAPVKTTAPVAAPVKTAAPVAAPAGGGTFSNAVLDTTRKQTILHVKPKKLFVKGSKVKVAGKLYNGTFNVWNVYTGNATLDAIYIDTPFKGVDSGTVTKV